jgi:hypothetical protein
MAMSQTYIQLLTLLNLKVMGRTPYHIKKENAQCVTRTLKNTFNTKL